VRRAAVVLALGALLVVVLAVIVWDRMLGQVTTPRDPNAEDVVLIVPRGADDARVLRLLRQAGLAPKTGLVDLYVRRVRRPAEPEPGEYRLSAASSLVQILDTIEAGDVVTHTVVLRPGWTAEQMADVLAAADVVPRRSFLEVVRDPEVARFLGVPAESLDGFLLPDVYAFPRGRSGLEVARALVERFHEAAPVEDFPTAPGRTRDLVRVAGLLERAPVPSKEWRLYAGLLWNRLDSGQTLMPRGEGGDSRVLFGPFDRDPDVKAPSSRPNPGPEALRAAARPARPGARFLVRREDGGFAYCRDLDCFYEALRAL
jgi:UPF0755 protein